MVRVVILIDKECAMGTALEELRRFGLRFIAVSIPIMAVEFGLLAVWISAIGLNPQIAFAWNVLLITQVQFVIHGRITWDERMQWRVLERVGRFRWTIRREQLNAQWRRTLGRQWLWFHCNRVVVIVLNQVGFGFAVGMLAWPYTLAWLVLSFASAILTFGWDHFIVYLPYRTVVQTSRCEE